MSGIWTPRIELISTLSETAGYKSGIALTRAEVRSHLPGYRKFLVGKDDSILRIRPEEYEQMFVDLLYALGVVADNKPNLPWLNISRKYPNNQEMVIKVMGLLSECINGQAVDKPIDLSPFLVECHQKYGEEGFAIGLSYVNTVIDGLQKSPWSSCRRVEWIDSKELRDLFESEGLGSFYGKFIDQRYIDYLARNYDCIDKLNWRKFEGLTAEYFDRLGFHVELGPGRDDGNIDVRVWDTKRAKSAPTMIIQCKRQREKVGKVVVKALYADLLDEGAQSGLIVTTSSLLPGAKQVCVARSYPIAEANRETLRGWVCAMRTPEAGVFLGG